MSAGAITGTTGTDDLREDDTILEVSNTIVDFDAGEVRHIVDGIGGGSGND